jgi:hypothetical protein
VAQKTRTLEDARLNPSKSFGTIRDGLFILSLVLPRGRVVPRWYWDSVPSAILSGPSSWSR